jgi:hypothetical protein
MMVYGDKKMSKNITIKYLRNYLEDDVKQIARAYDKDIDYLSIRILENGSYSIVINNYADTGAYKDLYGPFDTGRDLYKFLRGFSYGLMIK